MLLAEAGDMLNSGLASVGAVVATPIEETVTAGGLTVAGRTYIMRAITYSTPFLCDCRCIIPSFSFYFIVVLSIGAVLTFSAE